EEAGPPPRPRRGPRESVAGADAEPLAVARVGRAALLAEDDVRVERAHDARPLAGALRAAAAKEVVRDHAKARRRAGGAGGVPTKSPAMRAGNLRAVRDH